MGKIKHFIYCQSSIESFRRNYCKRQCNHCSKYYAPLELEYKRIPRKLKKKNK